MKYAILLAALLCGPANADMVVSRGGETLRLESKPCTETFIAPEALSQFRVATSQIGKNHYRACWTLLEKNQAVLVIYEDGDYGVVSVSELKNDPGI